MLIEETSALKGCEFEAKLLDYERLLISKTLGPLCFENDETPNLLLAYPITESISLISDSYFYAFFFFSFFSFFLSLSFLYFFSPLSLLWDVRLFLLEAYDIMLSLTDS